MTSRRAALLALALAFGTGCARNLLRVGGDAAVQVKDVKVAFEPGDRGDVDIAFAVHNPGLPSGALTNLQWEVWLGNRWFAAGTQQLAEPLPGDGTREFSVHLPIVFRRETPAPEEPRALEVGIRGAITVQAGGTVQRFPFQARRTVVAKNAPVFPHGTDEF